MITEYFHRKENKLLERLIQTVSRWGIYLGLPIVVIIISNARDIILVLFGDQYVSGYQAMIVLGIANFIFLCLGAADHLLIMTGNQKVWLRIAGIFWVFNFGLNWILVPGFGLFGAAFSTLITMSGLLITGVFCNKKILGIWVHNIKTLKGVLAALLSGGLGLWLSSFSSWQPGVRLLFNSIFIVFIFGLVLNLLKFEPEDYELMATLRKKKNGV
jgi:O-antigen/teichoic acid export membrane protein